VIWVTWRQHRAQALATLIGLGAIGVFSVITGPRIVAAFRELHGCLVVPGQDCSLLHDSFDRRFGGLQIVIPLYMVIPLSIGVFLGAPLIAREVEQGTHRLAWTQSVTRDRWALSKIGLVSAFALAAMALFAWMVTVWSGPLVAASDSRFGFGVFDLRGFVPVAYALFALALGTASGALIRKTLPAMAVTLGAFVIVRVAVEMLLRPRFLPAQTITYPFLQESPRAGLGDWLISSKILDPTGRFVSPDGGIRVDPMALGQVCPQLHKVSALDKDQVGQCLSQLGVRTVDTFQPGSRFWLFQGIESAMFLLLAAGLVVLAMWLIRRRIN
jgi:ABC-2 family transporter protein